MEKSAPFSLNRADMQKIAQDALYFFAAPIIIYLGSVYGLIQHEGHIASIKDFIPTNTTIIAIEGWFLGMALNTFRKFVK